MGTETCEVFSEIPNRKKQKKVALASQNSIWSCRQNETENVNKNGAKNNQCLLKARCCSKDEILSKDSYCRYYYYFHFTEKETEAERLCKVSALTYTGSN